MNFAENKHTYASKLVLESRAGAALFHVILEAVETACQTVCNVEFTHNGRKYLVDVYAIIDKVESQKYESN